MRTDDLIAQLASEPPAASLNLPRVAAGFLGAVTVPVAAFLLFAGVRAGLGAVLINPVTLMKTLLPALTAGLALTGVLRLMRPEGQTGLIMVALAIPLIGGLGLLGYTIATMPPAGWFAEWTALGIIECTGLTLMLSAAPAIAALRLFRRGASPAPRRSAMLAGIAAGAAASTGYSFFCTQDNPMFFVIWYGASIAIVTLVTLHYGRKQFAW